MATDVAEAVNKSVDQLKATGLSLQQQAEETVEQLKMTAEQLKETVDSWMQEKGNAKIEEMTTALQDMGPVDDSPDSARLILETYSWAAVCLFGFTFGQIIGAYILGFFVQMFFRNHP